MKSIVFSMFFAMLVACQFVPQLVYAQTEVSGADMQRMISANEVAGVKKAVGDNPLLLTSKLPTQQTALDYALQQRKSEMAGLLLDLGSPTDVLNRQKRAPIHEAIIRRATIVEKLIEKTDDPNVVDSAKATPLMYLVMYRGREPKTMELIKSLIEKGADINLKNQNQQTALHLACYYNRPELAQSLLDMGADLNTRDNNSNTPFLSACQVSSSLAMKMMDKGAPVLVKNRSGQTALHLLSQSRQSGDAAENARANLAIMDRFKEIDIQDQYGRTALAMTVMANNTELCKQFIKRGADPNFKPVTDKNRGQNLDPMACIAAQRGSPEMLKALIDGGAKVNVFGVSGDSPLHLAAQAGGSIFRRGTDQTKASEPFVRVLQHLLNAKANPDAKNKQGFTPFQVAAKGDFFAGVELLADKTEILEFDSGTGSLLHWGATNGLSKTTSRLISSGSIDVNQLDRDSRTPLHVAAANGFDEIVKLLLTKGAKVNVADIDGATPLLLAATSGNEKGKADVAKTLLNAGADSSKLDSSGQSALHLAAWNGSVGVVSALINRSVDLNLKTNSGYTPLHAAAWNGHHSVVGRLLKAGAKPNAVDSDGWTPLHKAAYRGHVKAVEALLANGADKSIKNGVEMTALEMAQSNQKKETIKLLK